MNRENQFVDNDFEEIANIEEETDLITKINTPVNILLLSLINIVLIMIFVVLFVI